MDCVVKVSHFALELTSEDRQQLMNTRAQLEAGDGEAAVKSFLEANAINPFDPLVHRILSDLFRKQDKTRLAARERKAYERLMRFLVAG